VSYRAKRIKKIYFHWVRALTVPMHLDLIDGPFVHHNLILVQESPAPFTEVSIGPQT